MTEEADLKKQIEHLTSELACAKELLEKSGSKNNVADVKAANVDLMHVAAATVKMPKLITSEVTTWFFQLEATFKRAKITSDATKFEYLTTFIDDQKAYRILGPIIRQDPFPPDAFVQAKKRLIAEFSDTKEVNLKKLLKGRIDTSVKPSQMLGQLRDLNEYNLSEEVLKTIFLECLPERANEILTLVDDKDIDTLAALADKLAPQSSFPQAFAASSKPHVEAVVDPIASLSSKLDQLITIMSKRTGKKKRNARSRSRNGDNENRNKPADRPDLCWAHTKFPNNPHWCKSWCSRYDEFLKNESKN